MNNFLRKNPIIYLVLFAILSFVVGIEVSQLIKGEWTEDYMKLITIVINLFLAFFFLYIYIRIKNNKEIK